MANTGDNWQSFSLQNSSGIYRYSKELNGYEVIYTPQVGFLQLNPGEMEEEKCILTKVMDKWETCRPLGDSGREIIRTTATDEIKEHIIAANS